MFVCKIKGYTREIRKYIKFHLRFVQILTKRVWNYSLISRVYHLILHTNIFLSFILNNHLFAPHIGKKMSLIKAFPTKLLEWRTVYWLIATKNNNKKIDELLYLRLLSLIQWLLLKWNSFVVIQVYNINLEF